MRPPSPSIPEKDFFARALEQGLRLDGRSAFELRAPTFAFGAELGMVEVALGKTRVLAHVDAKMVKPAPERPYEGILTIHSELSPMASTEYEVGRPSDEEVAITRMLDKVLRRSDAIDKESLCILAGERVWHLRLTLHALSDSGNLLDAYVLAGLTALRHFRRPEVEVVGDEVTVHPASSRAPLPLALHHSPFCLTFSLYPSPSGSSTTITKNGKNDEDVSMNVDEASPPTAFLDPDTLETQLAIGTLSVALNAQRELCVVHKAGGLPLTPSQMMHLIGIACAIVKDVDARVAKALGEDWETRKSIVEVR